MPAAHSQLVRKEVIESRSRGESFRSIATRMGISYDSVRALWRHWEKEGKLAPNYERCCKRGPRKAAGLVEQAVQLKREHPRWGAGLIRVMLSEGWAADELPSTRTLQRWFRQAGVNASPSQQQRRGTVKRGQAVHEVWAVDAKEKIRLADGSQVSWLTISDEASGAVLQAEAFPPGAVEPDRGATSSSVLAAGDDAVGKTPADAL